MTTGKTIALAIGWLLAAVLVSATTAITVLALDDDGGTTVVTTQAAPAAQRSAPAGSSIGDVYNAVKNSVVVVDATSESESSFPFGDQVPQQAQGSGFVFDDAGRVVTNFHVVQNADAVTIRFASGREVEADVVGTDPSTDVAVLEPREDVGMEPLELADSDEVQVGDPVIAIGSPFGLAGTVTSGIVSALDRTIQSPANFGLDGAIQTDAAINSGNSGGPLLDAEGRVIGINTQIQSSTGGNVGIGYAVPSNTIREVADELIRTGEVEHAYLGVTMSEADGGVRIEEIRAASPAESADLEVGDVIVSADGQAIRSPDELRALIDDREPGDELELELQRDGDDETVTVTLGERPTTS